MNKNGILVFFIIGLFMNMALIASVSPPPQPAIIYGDFEYSLGNPTIAAGITVVAKISGITYKTITTTEDNKYFIQIPTDNTDTAEIKEGGASGDTVLFYFNDVLANETISWPGAGATISKKLYIHHMPVLGVIGDKTVDENSLLTFTVSATDTDDDVIVYSATGLPTGATIGSSNGVFSWTPSYDQSGTYDVNFAASDGDFETVDALETITITVNNVNRAPVLNNSLVDSNFDEDGTKVINMNSYFSDPDGTTPTYTISGNTEISFDSDTMTFSATADWSGMETITVTASDGQYSISDILDVTVVAVNDAPTIGPDVSDITTLEDTVKTVDLTANENDVDNNEAQLTWSVSGVDTSLFSASIDSDDVLTVTPVSNMNGVDSVTLTLSDGDKTATQDITITVTAVNDAPTISIVSDITTAEDTVKTVDLTANENDVDNVDSELTWSVSGVNTSLFSASIDSADVITVTPVTNMNGADTVTLTLTDGSLTVTQDITITVTAVNDVPTASGTSATTNEDVSKEITLSASDVENNDLTYSVVDNPTYGTVSITGNVATYTPNSNYNGGDSFTFKATDTEDSNTATVSITVTAVNDAPVLATIANLTLTVKQTAIITPSATDVEDDSITYYINNTNFEWNGTAFNWLTIVADAGTYIVEVTASDESLNDIQIVTVTVNPEEVIFTKQLYEGWNLISVPVVVENTSVTNVLASIDGSYSSIYMWNATETDDKWLTYNIEKDDWMNDFTELNHADGFWLYMTANDTLNITGKIPHETNINIYKNEWNLVGYTLLEETAPDTVLLDIKDNIEIVFGNFEQPNIWESRIPDVGGTMSAMKQGSGYWIKSTNTENMALTYTNN
ncbi:tandem-95 repeat protein [archaeon]|nr:tandem-95 repeat protein [archaeon]